MSVNVGRALRKIVGWALIVYGVPFLIYDAVGALKEKDIVPEVGKSPRSYVRAVEGVAAPLFALLGGIYLIRGQKPPDKPVDRWH